MNSDAIMKGIVIMDRDKSTNDDLTLADHTELWAQDAGLDIPERGTAEWDELYEKWIEYAFEGFHSPDDA